MTQRPLYGVLVIGELPREVDHRAIAARHPALTPGRSPLVRTLSRWLRRSQSATGRSD
jgi:hypothetical protein